MKPLTLKISAFGPFKDEIEIDFSSISDSKIFLITGDTGSGKTSIFDAICYCLYNVSSGTNRTIDSLRSDYASKDTVTYVELKFSHKNKTYTIYRSPSYMKEGRKTKTQAEATLTYDDVVIDGVKQVTDKVTEILGIDDKQFKQISMLAQGEFLKLLLATSDERSKIFRKIFDTSIYNTLSEKLKNRYLTIKKKYDESNLILENEIAHIDWDIDTSDMLTEEIIKKLNELIDEDKKTVQKINSKINELNEQKQKLNNIITLAKIDNENINMYDKLQIKYQELSKNKPKYDLLEKDIEINKILIPINNEIIKISNYLNEKSNYLQKIEKEIVDINELYNKLLNKYQQLNSKKEELNELNIIKNKLQNNKKIYDQIEKNNKYIESFNKDELNNIINKITKLEELTKDNTISNKLENALKEQNETNKKINEYKEILKEIEKIENNLEKDYITLNIEKTKEKDLSNEYEHAEILFLKNQAGFLASMLKDNEPCMVCGSVNHPNKAILNNESITKNELDNLRSKLEKQIEIRNSIINRIAINNSLLEEKNKEKIVTELNKLTLIDFKIDELKNKEKEYLLNIEELKILKNKYDELKEIETNIKIKKANNNSLKESLFIYDDSLENVITKISELTNYIFKIDKEYNETLNSKNVLEKEIILVKNDIELKNKELNNLNIEFNKHNYNKELFTNNQLRELEIEYNEYYKEYDKVNTLIDNLKDKVKDKKIINIDNYINELNILNKQYDELLNNDTMLRYKTNKKVYENIVEQYNKNIDINKNYSMYKILSDTANGTISGKSKILFEQYVQSTYFNEIIKNSNYRLDIMTLGRYELRKKNDQQNLKDKVGLDLEVMDNYTGKIRDIKSLSGGESFKASLSLALGLSDTIQNYAGGIVVDTMFIDEGFGSLDSDSLEQALKTLNDLTSNNCLIGIISHVNELKQRIDKKIIVSKSTSGSTIKIEG